MMWYSITPRTMKHGKEYGFCHLQENIEKNY